MAARRKAQASEETDVRIRATPETDLKVETTSGESPARTSQGGGASAVLQVVRENPVPVGLVWAGLGWLVLSAAGVKRPQPAGAQQAVAGAQQAVTGAQQAVTGVVGKTQETVGQVATGAQTRARGLAGGARQRTQQAAGRARDAIDGARFAAVAGARVARTRAVDGAQRARTAAQTVVTQRPEVLQLAAAGAGAAVGLLVPATPTERKLVAPRRQDIVAKVDAVAEQALEKVEQTLEPDQPMAAITPA